MIELIEMLTIGFAVGLSGALVPGLFVFGHWMADLSWFSIVSAAFSKGKELVSSRVYGIVLLSCGVFLILFGSWFAAGVLA